MHTTQSTYKYPYKVGMSFNDFLYGVGSSESAVWLRNNGCCCNAYDAVHTPFLEISYLSRAVDSKDTQEY